MSTYSEHAAEAERLIVLASIQPDTDSSQAVTDAAQVHAMLALAEQQRRGNDLKRVEVLAMLSPYVPSSGFEATEALYDTHDDSTSTLRPDIADALGIKTGDTK